MADRPAALSKAERDASIIEALKADNFVSQFAQEGKELLAQTNRPNVITVAQFEPYAALFKVDKDLYKTDHRGRALNQYSLNINRLYQQWRTELGINIYEITIIIRSHEDPTIECYLDRTMSRIHSDSKDGVCINRESLAALPRNVATTQEGLVLDASVKDLLSVNQTPEQIGRYQHLRMESAIVTRNFTENNLNPNKRPDTEDSASEPSSVTATPTGNSSSPNVIMFLDDDD